MSIFYWQKAIDAKKIVNIFSHSEKDAKNRILGKSLAEWGIKNIFITNANQITMMNPHFHMWEREVEHPNHA